MKNVLMCRTREWKSSGFDPLYVDLVVSVLDRIAQGMEDKQVVQYLNYRKRGLPSDGEERVVVEDVTRAFLTEGTMLRDDVVYIREAEQRAQDERLKKARKEAKRLPLMPGVSDDVYRVWRLEQRYKNSLIPPGARGGGRSGRKRKKEARRSRGDATPLDVVIAKHNAYLERKRRLGIPV